MDIRLRQRERDILSSGTTADMAVLIADRVRGGLKITRDLTDLLCAIGYEPMVLHIGGPSRPSNNHLSFHNPNIYSHRDSVIEGQVVKAKWHTPGELGGSGALGPWVYSQLLARRFTRTRKVSGAILLDVLQQLVVVSLPPYGGAELSQHLLAIQAIIRQAVDHGIAGRHSLLHERLTALPAVRLDPVTRRYARRTSTMVQCISRAYNPIRRRFRVTQLATAIENVAEVSGWSVFLSVLAKRLVNFHLGISDGSLV
jgi:hypothetical protein